MDWFLHDRDPCYERVKDKKKDSKIASLSVFMIDFKQVKLRL